MDIGPIYELRSRLRAAAIAGTGLLSEDFRLKRAAEAMKPLETSSPVFAKIVQTLNELLSPGCPNPAGALLDTITLTDAVLCTLGTFEIKESVTPIEATKYTKKTVVNTPYTILNPLLEALTTSGSGHYNHIYHTHQTNPELFQDYRVKYALVQALGASYAELADLAESWLKMEDESILPLLIKDFEPNGKKEMMRRISVIDYLAKGSVNDFYLKMLETAQKDMRYALICALRHDTANVDMLFDMVKTERGKNKQAVFRALAAMDDERVSAFFRDKMAKKPVEVVEYLLLNTAPWSGKLITDTLNNVVPKLLKISQDEINDISGVDAKNCNRAQKIKIFNRSLNKLALNKEKIENIKIFNYCMLGLLNKSGEEINACYRMLYAHKEQLDKLRYIGLLGYNDCDYNFYKGIPACVHDLDKKCFEGGMMTILFLNLMMKQNDGLKALAMEFYEENKNYYYLPAAIVVKLFEGKDCTKWLDGQMAEKKHYLETIQTTLGHVYWSEKTKSYAFRIDRSCERDVFVPNLKWETKKELIFDTDRTLSDSAFAKTMLSWMMNHASKQMDEIMFRWIPKDQQELCAWMGEWYYKRALSESKSYRYLMYLDQCGWSDCKGLGIKCAKDEGTNLFQTYLYNILRFLPGSRQGVVAEAWAVYEAIKSGEIIVNKNQINLDALGEWIVQFVEKGVN